MCRHRSRPHPLAHRARGGSSPRPDCGSWSRSRRGWSPATPRRPKAWRRRSTCCSSSPPTLQVAVWARELVLGRDRASRRRPGGEQRPRQRDRHHPAARHHRHLRRRHRRRARQSQRQRHRPGRRPRHRRHRHRPRRQGHFRRPVLGAVDHLRQAVPPRRFDPLGHRPRARSSRSASNRRGCAR